MSVHFFYFHFIVSIALEMQWGNQRKQFPHRGERERDRQKLEKGKDTSVFPFESVNTFLQISHWRRKDTMLLKRIYTPSKEHKIFSNTPVVLYRYILPMYFDDIWLCSPTATQTLDMWVGHWTSSSPTGDQIRRVGFNHDMQIAKQSMPYNRASWTNHSVLWSDTTINNQGAVSIGN